MNRLLSYAYLKASHDVGQPNPLALVQNVVIDILRKLRGKTTTTTEVMEKVESDWGFKLPQRVIESIIRNKTVEQFYVYEGHGNYAIVKSSAHFENLAKLSDKAEFDLARVRSSVKRELLVQRQKSFFTADDVISIWLDKSAIGFFSSTSEAGISSEDIKINAIIASCIGVGSGKDEDFISALTSLALGDLLYRAMGELTEADSEAANPDKSTRMTNVTMCLDVGVISRLCGYYLSEEMQATSDFVNMCRRTGCEIKVFSHTVAEFKKVCTSGLIQVGRPNSHGPMGIYCLTTGRLPSDVIEEVADIESFLQKTDIAIIKTPSFGEETNRFEISARGLMEMIANEFSGEVHNRSVHRGDEADYNDYLSLRGIFILRGGAAAKSLESCGALFLTNTFKLQKVSNRFFKQVFSEQGESNEVQICFTESGIAPRIWLKVPTEFSKVARGQIIKAALSNLNPSRTIRESFLDYVKRQVAEKAVTESQALELKYSKYVDYALAIDGAFGGGGNSQQQFSQIVDDALHESRNRVKTAEQRGKAAGVAQAKAEIQRLEELGAAESAALASSFSQQLDDLRKEVADADQKLAAARARFAAKEGRIRGLLKCIAYMVLPGAIFWAEILPVIMGTETFHASTAVFIVIVLLAVFAVRFGLESEGGRSRLARKLLGRGTANNAEAD